MAARKDGCSKCEKRYEELNLLETMRVDCELICGDCLRQLTEGEIMAEKTRKFDTGATRDTVEGKLNYVKTLSPIVMQRYVEYIGKHRTQSDGSQRDWDNWKSGIPQEIYLEGQDRHHRAVWKLLHGFSAFDNHGPVTLEDSLCGVLFNAMGMLHEILKTDEKEFVVSEGWVIAYNDPGNHHTCGWYVFKKDGNMLLWKDGLLHKGGYSGYQAYHEYGTSPGYWPTEADAKAALQQYLEKTK